MSTSYRSGKDPADLVGQPVAQANQSIRPVGDASAAAIRGLNQPDDGIPQSLDDLTNTITRSFDLSVTAAMSLSIPVVGSVSGGLSRRVIVLERVGFKPLMSDDGSTIQYGFAIRLCVTVSKFDAAMKLSLPFLAASAEVGNISASWTLQILGLSGSKIDAVSIPPTELSVETFVLAKQSLTALIAAVRDDSTRFTAQIVGIDRASDVLDAALTEAAGQTYALSRIERKIALQDALTKLNTDDSTILDVVSDLYTRFVGGDPTTKPSQAAAQKASQLLGPVDSAPR